MSRKSLSILLLTTAILLVLIIGRTLYRAGTFKTINPHLPGTATYIRLPVAGPEDITIDAAGLAFISADDRRANLSGNKHVRGALLVLNLNDSIPIIRDITPNHLKDFHPHGISRFETSDGRILLFVVNHGHSVSEHMVERFEWKDSTLTHLETIRDTNLMTSPNDLVAVGERSFYVTNDHYYAEHGFNRTLEEYLQREISFVNHFNGERFRTVADGIAFANGITASNNGKTVYVTSTLGRQLLIYERQPDDSLVPSQQIDLSTGADNLEWDEHGDLWIGCHPQLLKFAAHGRDASNPSPSQALRISPSGNHSIEEIVMTDGYDYPGSSVAAHWRGHLLIGSVFDSRIMLVRFKSPE